MKAWWAVYSEPGRALLARDALLAAGLGAFCPVEQLTRRRKIPNRNVWRPQTVVSPVFGRYLFGFGAVVAVLACRGVADLVRAGDAPLEVPEGVVGTLRLHTRAVEGVGDVISTRDLTRLSLGFGAGVGDTVRFSGGALEGFCGVVASLDRLDESGMISAYVDMLGARREVVVPHGHVGRVVARAGVAVEAAELERQDAA